MNFYGKTAHNGAADGNQKNYVQTRYFPRNIQSLISNLEIKVNGRSVQNISQYIYIYNILNDYMCGTDATNKKRIGENADPSNKAAWVNGVSLPRRGYPVGLWNGNALTSDDKFDASARDAGDFSNRNWLGILGGGASTNIIHRDMYDIGNHFRPSRHFNVRGCTNRRRCWYFRYYIIFNQLSIFRRYSNIKWGWCSF
jgi:hypothetical protein